MVKEEACASINLMAKKANIQDPFEIIKKKIDTTGKEMLFTVMEFMNQKLFQIIILDVRSESK